MAQENINIHESQELDTTQKERQQIIAENVAGVDFANTRILEYQNKAPVPPEVNKTS